MTKVTKKEQENSSVSPELEQLRKQLREKLGEGTVRNYTEPVKIPRVSTGIIKLDEALDGGIPLGRMTELAGATGSGKTSIILSVMAQAQRQFPDKTVVYVDAEHALDTRWAAKLGVDLNRFEHIDPEFAEEAIHAIEAFAESGLASIIALDSVPALITKNEMEGDVGDANIGVQARIVAQEMKRIGSIIFRQPTALLFINQKRAALQARGGFVGYEPTKFTGGTALPFYMTTRLIVSRIGTIKVDDVECGQEVEVHVKKFKLGSGQGKRVTFEIDNNIGVDKAKELLNLAIEKGLVKKAGAWFAFDDEKVQGETQAKALIQKEIDRWREKVLS